MTPQRGSNISRVRDYNERLVLSLIRAKSMPRVEIARRTQLSAQTVSVITRALENDGLIQAGDPVRGRVGQPTRPLSLTADGAYFFGLKIGRRSTELALIDFVGTIVQRKERHYDYPLPEIVLDFVSQQVPELLSTLAPETRDRVHGMGVAMPFELWTWSEALDAPADAMNAWRDIDLQAHLETVSGLSVYIENDATAACGAELTFGVGSQYTDFAYFYIGYFIGGGVVLNRTVFRGNTGNAGAFGSLPIASRSSRQGYEQLIDGASIQTLEHSLQGSSSKAVPFASATSSDWDTEADTVNEWVHRLSDSLAFAIVSITSVIDCEAIVIDGVFPDPVRQSIVEQTRTALSNFTTKGIQLPAIAAGKVGPDARLLGAARAPMLSRFLIDPSVLSQAMQ